MGETCREVTIVNKRGLHARASAKFVAAVAGMDGCQVRVRSSPACPPSAAPSAGASSGCTMSPPAVPLRR